MLDKGGNEEVFSPIHLRPKALHPDPSTFTTFIHADANLGPYSNFRVGACVLLSTGAYHTGSNVEVASTPVGICAERCAIAPIVASIKRPDMPVIRAIAVATDISPPASPCGMCRQFINEFATSKDLPIYMYGKDGLDGDVVKMTIGELLPMSFGPNDMDRNK